MRNPLVYLADYAVAVRLMLPIPFVADVNRYRSGTLRPILLLPGVYESWRFMRPLADALHSAGHPVHVVRALNNNAQPIAEMARIAQSLLDDRDLKDVAIVAHSKGGLIAKHMMLSDDTAGRIASLVALATPFGGSRRARFMPVATLREFRPTEAVIVSLTANAIVNSRITSLYGSWDSHIPEGSALAGAQNIEVPVPGHFRLLVARSVIERVVSEVRS
jgi:triacylglycerol lipase